MHATRPAHERPIRWSTYAISFQPVTYTCYPKILQEFGEYVYWVIIGTDRTIIYDASKNHFSNKMTTNLKFTFSMSHNMIVNIYT